MSLDPPTYLSSLQNNIRARPLPWDGAVRAGHITEADLKKIKAVDKVRREQRRQTVESDVDDYCKLLLGGENTKSVLETAGKRADVVQYILVLTGDLIDDVPALTTALLAHPDPYSPFLPLLSQSPNPEDLIPLLASSVLTSLIASALLTPTKPTILNTETAKALPNLYSYLSSLAKSSDSGFQDIAVQAYSALLRTKKARELFWTQKVQTVTPLIEILRAAAGVGKNGDSSTLWSSNASTRTITEGSLAGTVGLQLLYHVLLVLWQLSFEGALVGDGLEEDHEIVPLLIQLLRLSPKEKTTRLLVSTLLNLIKSNQSSLLPASALARLPALVQNLSGRVLTDPDLAEDLTNLSDMLDEYTKTRTTFDQYAAEVRTGHLHWSPPHRNPTFWHENARRILDENKGELPKKLAEIMGKAWDSDKQVLAVACNDVGCLVKEVPEKRDYLEKLGLKARVMALMAESDETVRWESLRAVVKEDYSCAASRGRPDATRMEGFDTLSMDLRGSGVGVHNSNSKKRRRADLVDRSLLEPFVVKSDSSSVLDTSQTLKPALVLPRSLLPLSFLDPLVPPTTVPTMRLFSACIDALESCSGRDPAVLIARTESGRSLYVVEQVAKGVYALCKLGGWVKEENIRQAVSCPTYGSPPLTAYGGMQCGGLGWWGSTKADLGSYSVAEVRQKQLKPDSMTGIVLSMMLESPVGIGRTSNLEGSPPSNPMDYRQSNDTASLPGMLGEPDTTEQTAQEILDTIRVQYLDMLYVSHASLAYFPKGPLSRARAMINCSPNLAISPSDLITFLQSLVLSLNLMDKKYKTSVPDFIKSLPAFDFSDDDADPFVTKPKKKRKAKKMKVGKGGLYPGEDKYVKKWWLGKDSDQNIAPSGDSNAERIRRRVAALRTRETELQIILILEVFALQESAFSKEQDKTLEAADSTQSGKEDKKKKPKRRSTKELDLSLVLDLLLDRLCIWQSVGNGDGGGFELAIGEITGPGAVQNSRKGLEAASTTTVGTRLDNDHLRDFCNEVILPFYGARLPKQCTMLSHKLGGSTVSSSHPPTTKAVSSAKRSTRPGESVKRVAPLRACQTLERVLTDDKLARVTSRGPSVTPTLSRSATAPIVPGLKREASDTSLWSIPAKESLPPMNVCRGGVLKSKRFSQREIDMSFTTTKMNNKLQKKAEVEEELREAISTLKKPNRGLAIKEFVETSERRVLGGPGFKKLKKPLRSSTTPSVQVMATPKGNRKINALGTTPITYHNRSEPSKEQVPASAIKDKCVPQSVLRSRKGPRSTDRQLPGSRPGARVMSLGPGPSVQDSPSRIRSRRGSEILDNEDGISMVQTGDLGPYSLYKHQYPKSPQRLFGDSHSQQRSQLFSMAEITTPVKRSCAKGLSSSPRRVPSDCGVQETPLKVPMRDIRSLGVGAKEKQTTSPKDEDVSIYEALGWDDADDLP